MSGRAPWVATLALVASCSAHPNALPSSSPAVPRVLAFTKTTGYRHASIPAARTAVQAIGAREGFVVDATEDARAFTAANLARYRAVLFLLTTGDVLNDAEQDALRAFVEGGGGFAGVHSATDTEHDWAWYHQMLGATFKSHPKIQRAMLRVEDPANPLTVGLPKDGWARTDEWYNFTDLRPDRIHVLVSVLESSYTGVTMGAWHPITARHPITWCSTSGSSRVWYTEMGHAAAAYKESLFLAQLSAGIRWAAGLAKDGC